MPTGVPRMAHSATTRPQFIRGRRRCVDGLRRQGLGSRYGPTTHTRSRTLPASVQIRSAIRREDAVLRLEGDAFAFPMTWAADDETQSATDLAVKKALYEAKSEDDFRQARRRWRQYQPYFAFNAQRVTLKAK